MPKRQERNARKLILKPMLNDKEFHSLIHNLHKVGKRIRVNLFFSGKMYFSLHRKIKTIYAKINIKKFKIMFVTDFKLRCVIRLPNLTSMKICIYVKMRKHCYACLLYTSCHWLPSSVKIECDNVRWYMLVTTVLWLRLKQ